MIDIKELFKYRRIVEQLPGGSGGGGSLPAGAYWEALPIPYVNVYQQMWFEFNGVLYAIINGTSGNGAIRYVYKYINNTWTLVEDLGTTNPNISTTLRPPIEYNGKMHFFNNIIHTTFDGVSIVQKNNIPKKVYGVSQYVFVQDEKLKVQSESGTVYVWDEASDTWSEEKTLSVTYADFFTLNGVVYAFSNKNVYIYSGGTLTQFATLDVYFRSPGIQKDNKVYFYDYSGKARDLYEFDPATKVTRKIGAMPFTGTSVPITMYDNKIALISYELSYPATFVLHEVTE
jgi:hypothetical protein